MMKALRRRWYKPLRSILVGPTVGVLLAWILSRGSPIIAVITLLGIGFGVLWSLRMVMQPQTPEAVEAFMTELCVCGHIRREHEPAIFEEPVCRECECEWFLVPIVYGPWDSRFSTLRQQHQDYILFGDFAAVGLAALLICAYL